MSNKNTPKTFQVKRVTTTQALSARDIRVDYGHIMVTGAGGIALTVPTPIKDWAAPPRVEFWITNNSAGSVTCPCTNGYAQGGDNLTIASGVTAQFMCSQDGSGSGYIWTVIYDAALASTLTADEVAAITGAATPTALNVFATMADVPETAAGEGAIIAAATTKNPPVDADMMGFADSAAANVLKKATFTQIKAFLKTYFDTIYEAIFTADQTAAVTGANAPSAANVFATMGDVGTPTPAELGSSIAACSAKASPIDADSVVICDSAAANVGKETTIAELRTVMLGADGLGTGIAALAAKAVPIDADSIVLVDSADTNDAKETTIAELKAVMLSSANVGAAIAGYDAKASPIDADSIALCDSAAANVGKEVTLAQLRSALVSADALGTVIAGLAAKAIPIDADSIAICDSADTNDAKEVTLAELRTALLAADPLGTVVNGLTGKATPVDADEFVLADSAATNDAKKVTWAEIKTVIGYTSTVKTALQNSVNWQDWVPTIASSPAQDSLVARYQRIGNSVRGFIDVRGSDGDGWTPSTITLPVAPQDVNARIPIMAWQSVNAATRTNMYGYIDAETDLRIEFGAAAACTDTQAWTIEIWFEYEVAA